MTANQKKLPLVLLVTDARGPEIDTLPTAIFVEVELPNGGDGTQAPTQLTINHTDDLHVEQFRPITSLDQLNIQVEAFDADEDSHDFVEVILHVPDDVQLDQYALGVTCLAPTDITEQAEYDEDAGEFAIEIQL